jgi:hypothetical protein
MRVPTRWGSARHCVSGQKRFEIGVRDPKADTAFGTTCKDSGLVYLQTTVSQIKPVYLDRIDDETLVGSKCKKPRKRQCAPGQILKQHALSDRYL